MTRARDSVPEYRSRIRPAPFISASKALTRSASPGMASNGRFSRTGTPLTGEIQVNTTTGAGCRQNPAVASDAPLPGTELPVIGLDDIETIADVMLVESAPLERVLEASGDT